MKPIQIISRDVFDKVRSRFTNLQMGDETGAVTIDPSEARFFDFDFVIEGENLGRVSISLNDLGSLKVYYSQGITENLDDSVKKKWYAFLREMRFFAMRRLLRFDTRDIAKTNLDKNDFQQLAATQRPKEEEPMNTVNESKWNNKSTMKTSRAVAGRTEVIVRHAKPVAEYAGARSQKKNIKAIFIQNASGERYKYPFIHPAGAFAMAQHVDHGGVPHDPAGKAIIGMSEEIAQLQEFQRKIQRASLHDDAMGITEKAVGRLNQLKEKVVSLGKKHHYENWVAEFSETEHNDVLMAELDAVTLEDYKSKFTQRTFEDELTQYFPLLHRIMKETNKVDLEDYVGEVKELEEKDDKVDEEFSPEYEFESWAEAVEQGKLTDDQIEALKKAIGSLTMTDGGPQLELGPDGQTAWQFFNNLGIDDKDFEEKLKAAAEVDDEMNAIEVFGKWAEDNYPELLVALGMSGASEEQQQQPTTENNEQDIIGPKVHDLTHFDDRKVYDETQTNDQIKDGDVLKLSNNRVAIMNKAWPVMHTGDSEHLHQLKPGISWEDVGGKDYSKSAEIANQLSSTDETTLPPTGAPGLSTVHGTMENDEGNMGPGMMSKEGKHDPKSLVKEVAKIVKSFYNRDNPKVGPFRGNEGIAIDVEKKISEKFGESAGTQARELAEKFMAKLTQEWNERHGQTDAVDHDDGLARLKELLQKVKGKVENYHNKEVSENKKLNFNPRDYHYDQFEVFNPKSEEDENEPETIEVNVYYDVQGSYRSATQYDPSEAPEINIKAVLDSRTGEEINDSSVWDEVDEKIADEMDRSRYGESISEMKRLSGLKK